MPVNERVAGNIRAEMARQRIPQQAVADLLGITQQSVSYRLNGRTALDVGELTAIAGLLGVTAASLLGEDAAMSA